MTHADTPRAQPDWLRRLRTWLWSWRPPLHEPRFWVVQAGVLGLAALHDVVLDNLRDHTLNGVPAPTSSGLLLIPVIYAALNFGVRGAVATALWATALLIPNWFLAPDGTVTHFWIEAGYLLIVNAVAVVVGQRVESEQRARHSAEAALQTAKDAQARYYSLFEDQPAPVIITNSVGVIGEANAAAIRQFGDALIGRRVEETLGIGVAGLLDGTPRCLAVPSRSGQQANLVPAAHRLGAPDDAQALIQVVLADVTEQHRREEEERLFAGRLLTVQEEERRRLARELHDDPLQNLTYLTRTLDDLSQQSRMPAQFGVQLADARAVATEASAALRKLIHGLRPPVLDDLGLVSALRQLALDAGRRTALNIQVRVQGTEVRLTPELELAAYRIAQEALNNVTRHARAAHVTIGIRFDEADLVLTVADDGRGMPRTQATGNGSGAGLGLIGMRERVSMAGGSLSITRRPPHGTRVRAVLPVPARHLTDEAVAAFPG